MRAAVPGRRDDARRPQGGSAGSARGRVRAYRPRMDDVTELIERARFEVDVAHARLEAARRVRWEGVHGRAYADRLAEAAARVRVLDGLVAAAVPAVPPWPAP